ncbi:hypothetical protein [Lysinibacillus pakistanensis]|uniref:hypothetical protein n=1 Tax=Lysinibacillus pakistanensis TaxID=759811 RepID=UPI0028AFA2E8|nr:hypothetical protein [Lysinibacillus pakistanensis]
MTFEEVFNIVGSKGTNCDSNHTVIDEFETAGAFSTANMTFQGNKNSNRFKFTALGFNASLMFKVVN